VPCRLRRKTGLSRRGSGASGNGGREAEIRRVSRGGNAGRKPVVIDWLAVAALLRLICLIDAFGLSRFYISGSWQCRAVAHLTQRK
jgi:hypothetical protein